AAARAREHDGTTLKRRRWRLVHRRFRLGRPGVVRRRHRLLHTIPCRVEWVCRCGVGSEWNQIGTHPALHQIGTYAASGEACPCGPSRLTDFHERRRCIMKRRLVVVGGVAAGMSAASRAKRVDPGLDVVVLEKGDYISYGACSL